MLIKTGIIIFMLACGISDYRCRAVDIKIFAAGLLLGIYIMSVRYEVRNIYALIADLIPGLMLTAMSFMVKGSVGTGDGIYFTEAGMMLGCEKNIIFILATVVLCAVYGLFKKNIKKLKLPMLTAALPAGIFLAVI